LLALGAATAAAILALATAVADKGDVKKQAKAKAR